MDKAPRASTEQERLALKAAVSRGLKMAGGAASFQLSTRLDESSLSRDASPHHPERHLSLDVALDLDREAQSPVILSELARLQGYGLRARATDVSAPLNHDDLAGLMSQSHRLVSRLVEALADQHVSNEEARAITRDIDEQIKLLTALRGRVSMPKPKG